jgi:hypothetical protein
MIKSRTLACLLHSFLWLCLLDSAYAADYYRNDFESGTMPPVNTPSPVWTLNETFKKVYGPGNHFEVTDIASHSGNYSLRFLFEGRNGVCNTCGGRKFTQLKGHDNADYFIASGGENLAIPNDPGSNKANAGPNAQPGRRVYNLDNGYSLWEVVKVNNENATNDKLTLKLLKPNINGGTSEINSGDTVSIKKECGVDGYIGLQIDRRSDCNDVITWFQSVQEQTPGTSIFRRMYLKQEITNPLPLHMKLNYFRPNSKGSRGSIQGSLLLMALFENKLVSLRHPYPTVGARQYGAQPNIQPGSGMPMDTKFERGVWYYVEIQYKTSTFDSASGEYNSDGEYRLWFAKSGEETNTPIVELTNLQLPALDAGGNSISFWGNIQHYNHLFGSWYIDDVVISNTRVGFSDVARDGSNIAPSKSPEVN